MKTPSPQEFKKMLNTLLRPGGSTAVAEDDHCQPDQPRVLPAMMLVLMLAWGIDGRSQAAVVVESPGASVAGKTIGAWSAAWWQWAAPLAPPGDPFTDTTGAAAGTNQSGPVFFLAGSEGGSNARHFTVPAGTYLLVPLLVGELSQLELGFSYTSAQVKQAAKQQADMIDSLHATFDGTLIPQATLFTHREASQSFSFVAAANNQVGISGVGDSGIAIADGYLVMLDPLAPGTHVLNFGGGISAYGLYIDETDTITVLPPVVLTAPKLSAGQFGFGVTGPSGSTVVIESSTNLLNWQAASTNILVGGSNYFTAALQGQSNQYYRARAQ
jgi:hypothetical protein